MLCRCCSVPCRSSPCRCYAHLCPSLLCRCCAFRCCALTSPFVAMPLPFLAIRHLDNAVPLWTMPIHLVAYLCLDIASHCSADLLRANTTHFVTLPIPDWSMPMLFCVILCLADACPSNSMLCFTALIRVSALVCYAGACLCDASLRPCGSDRRVRNKS